MNTAVGEQEDIPSAHPLWEERKKDLDEYTSSTFQLSSR